MKVLVTGGAGYIGSHTVNQLLEKGHQVIVYDNLSTGFREAIPGQCEFIFGDIRDGDLLARVMKDRQVDAVIHFAAKLIVPESLEQPWDYYETNVLGGLRVAQACVNSGVKHMIFSSTAAVYGEANREASTEDDSIHPMTPYGASKWMVEEILKKIGEECEDFQWISLRYFNVAGASLDGKNGQRTKNATHLVKVAAEAAAGKRSSLHIFGTDYPTEDGTCVRDFIHVEDLARAHVMALESLNENHHVNEIYNCGYGMGVSVRQVIDTMKKVSEVDFPVTESPRRPGDPSRIVAGVQKIKSQLGWDPQCQSLDLICQSAYKWEVKTTGGARS